MSAPATPPASSAVGFAANQPFRGDGITALIGPPGSGKSDLLRDLAESTTASPTDSARSPVGFVHRSFNLVPSLTVMQNICLPSQIAGHPLDDEDLQAVVTAFGLAAQGDLFPESLSGEQKQRTALARAFAGRPELVLADEPAGNLDADNAAKLLHHLRHAVDQLGQTVILATRDPGVAMLVDHVVTVGEDDQSALLLRDSETSAPISTDAAESDTLPASLDDIAPPRPLSGEQERIVHHAQRILEQLPGPVTPDEDALGS